MSDRNLYVQYGCGFSAVEDWLNFDSSPTLRIERIPLVGSPVSALFSGNRQRFPSVVKYGDICKGLPVADGSVVGCYASHVLEHLSFEDMREALANTFRMLAPGGIFRLIVPDLHARARRYVAEAARDSPDAAVEFVRSTLLGHERRPRAPLQYLRHLLGGSMHLWMWDFHSMSAELARAGFVHIRRCEFGDAADPMFARVERKDRFFDEDLGLPECAIEAHRPNI
ncbi:MAG: methyltransferase domain-containing protein [Enhydrobacter sp.]|nr:methyltransferase domain-containing protein [Enhydrobacter sp.]